jgi:hypothetical protein
MGTNIILLKRNKGATMTKKPNLNYLKVSVFVNCVLVVIIFGCSTRMAVSPQIEKFDKVPDFRLKAKIDYDGKYDYLPRTVLAEAAPGSDISISYKYLENYGRDNIHQALPLFNPLSLVGFPIGENTLIVSSKLTISKNNEVVKEYSCSCALENTRSLFSEGETFSELRKKGLLTVRDNIESQMYHDKDFLLRLLSDN